MTQNEFTQAVSDLREFLMDFRARLWQEHDRAIVPIVSAPSTYKALRRDIEAYPTVLFVYSEGSENTIFGDKETNYVFRAWHDWGHYTSNKDFQFHNECALGVLQSIEAYDALYPTIGHERAQRVKQLVQAEIIGRVEYYQVHRQYIDDQKAYVKGYLGVI